MRILSVYNSIFQLVPSKIDYIKKFFYFIFGSSLDLLSISLIPLIVSKVINTESRSNPFLNKYFDYDLKYLIIFLLGVFTLKLIVYLIIYYNFISYSYDIKNSLLKKIFLNIFSGKEAKKKDKYLNLVRTTESFVNNVLISSFYIAFEVIVIIAITIYLLFWNFQTTIYLFGTLSVFVTLYLVILRKKMKILGKFAISENENILKFMNYATEGFREIILYKKLRNFISNVNYTLINLKGILIRYDIITLLPRISFELIVISLFAILFFTNSDMASSLILNSSVYLYAFVKISPSLIKIVNLTNAINYGEYATKIIKEETRKKINNRLLSRQDTRHTFNKLKIYNLSYELNNNVIIKYPSINIERNDKVLIYGKSGKGKSTLLDLICGFKTANTGTIKFYNQNNKIINPETIISYSPQDTLILNESLKKNIAFEFDNKNKGKNEYDNIKFKFNRNLYNSKNILNASAGEKKRISILRVFYNKNDLYIFDEPTSNLDMANTEKFFKYIYKVKNKTIIIVTHNLKYKKYFNKVIEI